MDFQRFIRTLDPDVNPAAVEASARLAYEDLEEEVGLDEDVFLEEIKTLKALEQKSPGWGREAAELEGLADDYDRWENESRSR